MIYLVCYPQAAFVKGKTQQTGSFTPNCVLFLSSNDAIQFDHKDSLTQPR